MVENELPERVQKPIPVPLPQPAETLNFDYTPVKINNYNQDLRSVIKSEYEAHTQGLYDPRKYSYDKGADLRKSTPLRPLKLVD